MRAQLLAFAAAACGVLAAWEAVGAAGAAASRLVAVVAPLRGGREPDAAERRRLIVTGALAVLAGGWLLAGPVLGVALAAVTPLALRQALVASAARRRALLVDAAPVVARAIADALAAGNSIRAAIAGAHRGGVSGSARELLARLRRELEMGEPTAVVLERLRVAAGDPSYDAIVAAILLQAEAGGDLAGLLRRLAATLEADARAQAGARSLTAQARFTAALVALLPAVAAMLAELAAPGSVRALLAQPLSAVMTLCAVALQLVAWVVIRRAARPLR